MKTWSRIQQSTYAAECELSRKSHDLQKINKINLTKLHNGKLYKFVVIGLIVIGISIYITTINKT